MKVLSTDDVTRTAHFSLEPDPRRYTSVTRDGEAWFLDKYLDELIPLKAFVDQMAGLPVYNMSPSIKSTPEYAARRKEAVAHELKTGEHVAPLEVAMAHKPFDANQNTRSVAFVSIDVCGGTALRRADMAAFDRAYKILIAEFGTAVGHFSGSIVKLTGDGFIACIDHPSFTSLCDMTVDLGLSLLALLRDSINPELQAAGLTPLHVRIGAEYGEAEFRPVVIPATGFSDKEIASDALNRAVKVQESCEQDEFRIGGTLYRLIHVQWLERAKEVPFEGEIVGMADYKTYRMS